MPHIEPPVTLEYIPELGISAHVRIVPTKTTTAVTDGTREIIIGEMQYSVSGVSGPFEFLTWVPFGLPVVSGT